MTRAKANVSLPRGGWLEFPSPFLSDPAVTFASQTPLAEMCALSVADEPRTDIDRLRRNRVTRQVRTRLHSPMGSMNGERPSHKGSRITGNDPHLCFALDSAETGSTRAATLGIQVRESPAGRHDDSHGDDCMAKGTTATLKSPAHERTPPKLKHTD